MKPRKSAPHFEVYLIDVWVRLGSITLYHRTAEWRWRLRAANGEIVASGEGYTRKADALRAIGDVKRSAAGARTRSVAA